MKKMMVVCFLVCLLWLPSAVWAADSVAVTTDFTTLLPADARQMLAKGTQWQTVEFAESKAGYTLLLCSREQGDAAELPEQMLYLLLQLPQHDWGAASSCLWKVSAGQGADYGALPMMQVMEDAVWLQFWENGQYRIICAAQNGAVQERTFSGKTDASLTEHGAVGYDDTRKAFVLWDGMQETVYPISTSVDKIGGVAELQRKVYYLDTAGTLYQVTVQTETIVDTVQQYCQRVEELTQPLEYVDSLNLFYADHKLWLAANDWALLDSYLLCYDGQQMTKTEIPAGRVQHCSVQGDGSLQLLVEGYFPAIPMMMPEKKDVFLWTLHQQAAKRTAYQCDWWTVPLQYTDCDGLQWQYNLSDSAVQFYQKQSDGTTLGYGLSLPQPKLHVTVQGQEYYFDQQPYMRDNRVLIPLRGIASLLGAEVQWKENTVLLRTEQGQVQLQPGRQQAIVNGKSCLLDVPAENQNGRVMVPLRFVAESLQANVIWHQQQQTVEIIK